MNTHSKIAKSNRFFNLSSIRNRIWLGFTLILFILLFISLNTLGQFSRLNKGINQVTSDIQPVVLTAQNLEARLEATSNMLGFYLLTKEDSYRKNFLTQLNSVKNETIKLSQYKLVTGNDDYLRIVTEVQNDINVLESYREKMVELVADPMKNIPAQKLANQNLNPVSRKLQSMIGLMIDSDFEEDSEDGSRDKFRRTLFDLRFYNIKITSELRNYMAFRSQTNLQNIYDIENLINAKLNFIESNANMYTFEQSDLMASYIKADKQYFKDLKTLAKIHSTDRFRTDIFLVKTEIGPLIKKIETNLGSLVDTLKTLITRTSNTLHDEASGAKNQVLTGMIIGLLVGCIIAFLIARMITIPINDAMYAMNDL
ncbi:hypothetical protein MNBD_GAMMA07-287, partial [hydrothermal vent metagenome]